jgi:hypothetical protein
MTSYLARLTGRDPGSRNQKDGGRRQPVQTSGFWGIEGFMPTRTPGEWTYGPFTLVSGWIAICDNGRQIPIGTASVAEIKQRLDDEIAVITGVGPMIDFEDWTDSLTPTESQRMGRVNTRPGAEYGVIV